METQGIRKTWVAIGSETNKVIVIRLVVTPAAAFVAMSLLMIAKSLIVTRIFISVCVTMCITRQINRSRISPDTNNLHTVAWL